jgi:YggT family protein
LHVVGVVIETVLYVFIGLMFARMIASFVQMFARSWAPTGILLILLEVIYSITDPPYRAMRRVVPPIRIGNASFDLAFTLLFLLAVVLRAINASVLL